MKVTRLYAGRYQITINGKEYTVFNPSKDDKDYPNKWFIRDHDSEGYETLKEAKEYLKSLQ